jgi:hypothetical protein
MCAGLGLAPRQDEREASSASTGPLAPDLLPFVQLGRARPIECLLGLANEGGGPVADGLEPTARQAPGGRIAGARLTLEFATRRNSLPIEKWRPGELRCAASRDRRTRLPGVWPGNGGDLGCRISCRVRRRAASPAAWSRGTSCDSESEINPFPLVGSFRFSDASRSSPCCLDASRGALALDPDGSGDLQDLAASRGGS